MDNTKDIQRTQSPDVLGSNTQYYRYIFKKTEKIVCSVFYITHRIKDNTAKEEIIKDVERSASDLLEHAHESLSAPVHKGGPSIGLVQQALMRLESKLRILHAAAYLSGDLLDVFIAEIDSVYRNMSGFKKESVNPLFSDAEELSVREIETRTGGRIRTERTVPSSPPTSAQFREGAQKLPNRRGRILGVIREKGQASIKDISDVVKDCSEKTIQRELNEMIKDNIVVREGERRWSKYSILG